MIERRVDEPGLELGDWLRYGFLLFLASLVFVILYGTRPYPFASLLAVYLLAGTSGLLFVRWRRSRS